MKSQIHPYLTRQNMLTSDYEIFHYSDLTLNEVSLHHHDFYECYLFLSGDLTYLIEGKTYSLMPGDIILINTRELHQPIINSHMSPYERIVLWIDKNFLSSLSSASLNLTDCFEDTRKETVIRAPLEAQQQIRAFMNQLLCLETYSGPGKDLLYKAYIVELMVYLNTILYQGNAALKINIKNNHLIDEVIQYINNHLEDEIRIEELSKQFFISKYHLLREFKKHSGTTIHKFIIQKKLILSKELILKGYPIISVYKQCGFGDYSNFFRAFKNEYGMTPKQFHQIMNKG